MNDHYIVNNITLIYHSPDLLKNIPESVVRGLFPIKMYILLPVLAEWATDLRLMGTLGIGSVRNG
ncbi:hypothetical protein Pcaca05_23690 [Pectobacterium carotovorum subsp. carotovorum]|nr:hypothetical protein Pcaca05_23690 [Pectobacterium carotovorum subsp. carotovorum]